MSVPSEPVDATAGGSLFLQHLATYSLVDYAYKTAKSYYTRVKTANKYLEYGCDTAEYVATSATKTAAPLLSKVDAFGYKQLVRTEETLSGSYEKVVQLPYNFLEKTLELGEDSLDYWLPVADSDKTNEYQEKQEEEKEPERNFSRLSSRAYTILDSFQGRAKDKLYAIPVVSAVVDSTKAKLDDARALKKRVLALPTTLRQFYTEQRDAILAKLAVYYSALTRPVYSLTDRAFDLLHHAKHEYEVLRSSSFQEIGVRLANNVHNLYTYLYESFYPTTALNHLNRRAHQLVDRLVALNPLREKPHGRSEKQDGNGTDDH